MGVVLAIDHGTKKTGFAVAPGLPGMRLLTEPLDVAHAAGDKLLEHIAGLCAEREVERILIGLPMDMDGGETGRAKEVRAFGDELGAFLAARGLGAPVSYWDERLSTREADELLVQAGFTGEDRKMRRDSWSALVVLRDWIEAGEPE